MDKLWNVLAGLAVFSLIFSVCVVGAIALGRWWTNRQNRRDRMPDAWLLEARRIEQQQRNES